jgi:NADH:ubiquinone reductase (H+-translocating)
MGKLIGGNLFIEGIFAGLMHKSLYKIHQLALHG